MPFFKLLWGVLLFCGVLAGCSENREAPEAGPDVKEPGPASLVTRENDRPARVYAAMPDQIDWLTNDTDPVFASPDARKGGLFRAALLSFPMTFRVVGPDSNGSFRSAILDNQLSLINIHPNTGNIIPELATHWGFDPDKKNHVLQAGQGCPMVGRQPGHGMGLCLYPDLYAVRTYYRALVQ